jgi:hypothetical protein
MTEDNTTIATLAAAIVIARGAKTVPDIQDAWADAAWTVFPQPNNSRYKLWQEHHGLVATTLADDEAAAAKRRAQVAATRMR